MAVETLSFWNNETSEVLTLEIAKATNLRPDEGYWDIEKNQVIISSELWEEWQNISGDAEKQKKFLHQLRKISQTKIK